MMETEAHLAGGVDNVILCADSYKACNYFVTLWHSSYKFIHSFIQEIMRRPFKKFTQRRPT